MTTAVNTENDDFDRIIDEADKLPDDPLGIAMAVDGMTRAQGEPAPETTEGKPEQAPAATAAEPGKPEETKAGDKTDATPGAGKEDDRVDGVLLKDGQKVLPYSVLQTERRRADEAQRRAQDEARARQEAEQRIKDLESKLSAGEKSASSGGTLTQADVDSWSEELAELKDAVPEFAEPLEKALKAFESRISALQTEVAGYRERERERAEREAVTVQEQVQEAIDRNPTLRYLQSQKNELWDRAAEIDKQLRENPLYADYTFDERFAEVVKHLERRHGAINVPAEFLDVEKKQTETTRSSSDTTKARTEAKPAERPMTLTDLPGGAPPADAATRLENMTNAEREAAMQADLDRGMSQADWLAKWA